MDVNYRATMTYTNDWEKFVKAVDSIKLLWSNLTIIDNSINKCVKLKYPNIDIHETFSHVTCSQSFNIGQNIARKYNADIWIMMHSDMEVKDENKLKEFLDYLKDLQIKWGICFTHYDALAAFNMDCCDVIGSWDQNITQYPIDVDYYYRMRKYGFECLSFNGDWVDHHPSSTIRKNIMMDHINLIHTNECNNSYYQKKWGGARDQEQYIFPFNGIDLNKQYLKIISNPIYERLLNSYHSSEGSFLYDHSEKGRLAQFTLMLNIVNAIKPKKILEVGTHKYFFPLFLSNFIENFTIHTFDADERCMGLYDIANDYLKNNMNIYFHLGNSKETLTKFKESNIDLAWIDGACDVLTCSSDLMNCGRLKIPYILSDDSRLENVRDSITIFLHKYPNYYIIPNPYWQWDNRGITVIKRRRNS